MQPRGDPLGPNWSALWTTTSATSVRKMELIRCNENKVGACPERGGKAAASARRKNNVVVIGRPQTLDDRWRWLRLRDREMREKAVDIRLCAVALRDKGDLRVLGREVPTERCRERERVFIRLL